MGGEQKQQQVAVQGDEGQKQQTMASEQGVPPEVAEALIDKLTEIEQKVEQAASRKEEYLTLDDLQELLSSVEESQGEAKKQGNQGAVKELEGLKQQLQAEIQRLQEELLELKVLQEVEKCRQKYEDFDQYQKEMLELSVRFPNASVEDLYLLAKAKYGNKGSRGSKPAEKRTLTLEELRAALRTGEKPTGAGKATEKSRKELSLAEAAAMAAEEIFKE